MKKVRINKDRVKVYMGPSESYQIVGEMHQNEEFRVVEEKNGWGLLKSRAGWFQLKYADKIL